MPSNRFKTYANLGIGLGLITMFTGSALVQSNPEFVPVGVPISVGGSALLLLGCVNYARWKGLSGWFGALGYLLLPGLIILACLPNYRKRAMRDYGPDATGDIDVFAEDDGKPGYRFLLVLLPLALLFVGLGAFQLHLQSNVDPAEWTELAPEGIGFEAAVPGTPELGIRTQETPVGTIELHNYAVKPKGKEELFMVISIRYPEDAAEQMGGTEGLLELGRQDVLAASQGQIRSEKRISVSGHPGLDMEVLPAGGAVIRVWVCVTDTQMYQVSAHVPLARLHSEDVQRFFRSFKLLGEPKIASESSGM